MRSLAPGTVVGGFRIDGLLGRGGMSTVYLATQASPARQVALKLLDPQLAGEREFVERFRLEGRLQASLDHPHIVPVYEAGEFEGGLFLALQLIRGPTLATLIAGGSLTGERTLALLAQVASALDTAHTAGLVHRDVKPRNVLVGEGNHAYLADFGLTKLGGEGITVTGEVLGTLAYLAPEVIRGEPATAASDRYAFAAVAFECLTGGVVFPRPTQAAQLHAHASEPAPRITGRRAELPRALDEVFARALAKRPGERPATARAFVDSLRGVETLAPPPPVRFDAAEDSATAITPVPAPATRRRGRAALVPAVLVGAALTAVGAVLLDGNDAATQTVVAIPPPLRGMTVLGSDLRGAGVTRDCRGGAVRADSPECTVTQAELPGARLVVPSTGVVRRWALRDALGEFQLQVARPRDNGFFQVALSRSEFVSDRQVHAFPADLAVEAGDVLGLLTVSGSGFGVRSAAGATTNRWFPRLRGPITEPGHGPDGELLLRVEYEPGGRQRYPTQVRGTAAAELPPGRVVRARRGRAPKGREVEIKLVRLRHGFALDLFQRGRRLARLDVPGDFVPGAGSLTLFSVDAYPDVPLDLSVYMEYKRTDSSRTLSHFITAHQRDFDFVN